MSTAKMKLFYDCSKTVESIARNGDYFLEEGCFGRKSLIIQTLNRELSDIQDRHFINAWTFTSQVPSSSPFKTRKAFGDKSILVVPNLFAGRSVTRTITLNPL